MGCDYTRYPNYGPLTRKCRRAGQVRSCGHHLCDRHALRHEGVCTPPLPLPQLRATLRPRASLT